jgi:phosphinothricin acetyltransferase
VSEVNGIVNGWCSLSPYRTGRQALRSVAEISYYIHKEFRGQGFASSLISYSVSKAPELGFKNLIAILLELNKPSIYLLEKFQFERWGYLPDVAHFEDVSCGQFIYGRKIF